MTVQGSSEHKESLAKAQGLPTAYRECVALAVPLLSALVELIIRNAYHEAATENYRFVYLAVIALTVLPLGCLTHRLGTVPKILRVLCRVIGLVAWAWIVWAGGADLGAWLVGASFFLVLAVLTTIVALAWLASGDRRWQRAQPALLVGTVLFVGSQLLLANLNSQHFYWPEASRLKPSLLPAPKAPEGVAFVLLDELNSRDGVMLAGVLKRAGMEVVERDITPVADATSKVIPHIWTAHPFPTPKPCSFTTICSGNEALDFSKVRASRTDIDVVGFFHPYCAMQGLRSCARIGIPLPFDKANRWACALKRRFNQPDNAECRQLRGEPWIQLRDHVLQALFRAPFWRAGGLLYAHLPLPHPPGKRIGGTLREHYADNLEITADLLREIVLRLNAAGFQRARIVVFSDHPLRVRLHCDSHIYQTKNCESDAGPQDERVPLIVAGINTGAPDLSGITTNAQVFTLSQLPP